ncbi:hypothetical protein WQE_42764 [Paraburkholderia hospita]|uniref:Lipoprotein n=1 Tax=Paraburkholderia hospita TaxID=169430 RepID=A0ABN0F7X7_9BURK|nr:hypothetical protein WQE_42764 [Paraburkholderia hospita]OUL81353.1 hypothetical protein CA602_25485 [Paraburkholderia hospita]OUL83290.1 hypothetical protein CA603_26485 [Paraburkholderia hospita]
MNAWHLATATITCLVIVACSRRESVFSLSPVHTAISPVSASTVSECVLERWKNGTRDLRAGKVGDAMTLRAQALFDGASIGLRIRSVGGATSVEYYQRRRARPLYWAMVSGCLQQKASDTAGDVSEPHS